MLETVEFDDEENIRGCSCGMADYGAPGHDGHDTEEMTNCEDCNTEIPADGENWYSDYHGNRDSGYYCDECAPRCYCPECDPDYYNDLRNDR